MENAVHNVKKERAREVKPETIGEQKWRGCAGNRTKYIG